MESTFLEVYNTRLSITEQTPAASQKEPPMVNSQTLPRS